MFMITTAISCVTWPVRQGYSAVSSLLARIQKAFWGALEWIRSFGCRAEPKELSKREMNLYAAAFIGNVHALREGQDLLPDRFVRALQCAKTSESSLEEFCEARNLVVPKLKAPGHGTLRFHGDLEDEGALIEQLNTNLDLVCESPDGAGFQISLDRCCLSIAYSRSNNAWYLCEIGKIEGAPVQHPQKFNDKNGIRRAVLEKVSEQGRYRFLLFRQLQP
jgi:hypothetical protein